MGADCRVTLPGDTRGGDVAEVIGILAGLEPSWTTSGNARWVTVGGVSFENGHRPACPEIYIRGNLVDGQKAHSVMFYYEWGIGSCHGIMPPSTPFWCAVAYRLVCFFGGKVDYNDCDDSKWDFLQESPRPHNNPDDGKAWDSFQNDMMAIKPLTKEDIDSFNKYAAYND